MTSFTPLRVHSHGSLLHGTASPEALIERALELGYEALALTDRNNLYLAIRFYRHAHSEGLRPLLGCTLGAGSAAVTLIPVDRRGYAHLCRLVTRRHLEPGFDLVAALAESDPEPAVSGLHVIVESPGLAAALRRAGLPAARGVHGPLAGRAHRDRAAAGLWMGVRGIRAERPRLGERVTAARALGLPLVATGDVVMLAPADHDAHRVAVTAAAGELLERMEPAAFASPDAWLAAPAEWERRVRAVCAGAGLDGAAEEALAHNRELVARCRLEIDLGTPIFPRAPLAPGETGAGRLLGLGEAGVQRRYGRDRTAARARLCEELAMIERMGFTDYFLLVAEIVEFARARGIPTVGRGSGASSIVAYCLGITNVDPLRYGLAFERFLNPGRRDCPDLDIDLCWKRRDDVIAHVYETYGRDRVAMISTHATLGARSAFRETAKALGVSNTRVNALAKRVPHELEKPYLEHLARQPEARGIDWREPPLARALELAERLDGAPRHLSVHCGGIVIADRPLTYYVPLERAAKDVVVTQFEMRAIEAIGLVKMDLLGNRALSTIGECLELVSQRHGGGDGPETLRGVLPAAISGDGPEALRGHARLRHPGSASLCEDPLRHPASRGSSNVPSGLWPIPADGDASVSSGVRSVPADRDASVPSSLRSVPADRDARVTSERLFPTLDDLDGCDGDPATAARIAAGDTLNCFQLESPAMRHLLRMLEARSLDDTIAAVALVRPGPAESGMKEAYCRRRRGLEATRFLHPRLEGVLGSTYGVMLYEEDVMRVAAALTGISLAAGDDLRRAIGAARTDEEFRSLERGFVAQAIRAGVGEDDARAVWRDLTRFASYGFCKAHAAGYGTLGFQSAYLKSHFPTEYAVGILNHHAGMYSTWVHVEDLRRQGVAFAAPCAQRSAWDTTLEDGAVVRVGLGRVYGLAESTGARIVAARGARRFESLADFLDRARPALPEVETLILAGALDWTGRTRPSLLLEARAGAAAWKHAAERVPELAGAGGSLAPVAVAPVAVPELPEFDAAERTRGEVKATGLWFSGNPLDLWIRADALHGVIPAAEIGAHVGRRVAVGGMPCAYRRVETKSGGEMLFTTLADRTGLVECVLFPDAYRAHAGQVRGQVLRIAGRVDDTLGAVTVVADRVEGVG